MTKFCVNVSLIEKPLVHYNVTLALSYESQGQFRVMSWRIGQLIILYEIMILFSSLG